jgi:hypothetical protein
MFVRFRQQGRRLQASLVQTRRVAGMMQNEHIASLGSVDADVSIRERIAFWIAIEERLARLGNRVGPDDRDKIVAALGARIPFLTPDDLRVVQQENAKADEQLWTGIRDMNAAAVEGYKGLIATAEKEIAGYASTSPEVAERADAAKERLARLERGEPVVGGIGKKFDIDKIMKEAGIPPSDARHMLEVASLTEDEFKSVVPSTMKAMEKVERRIVRQILRARGL